MAAMRNDNGYQCSRCGTFLPFSGWVYTNWAITLTHICDGCQQEHRITEGVAEPVLCVDHSMKHVITSRETTDE